MFDVFYFGPKPNQFAHEQPAESLDDAADKSRTTYYWYIYGGNDYSNFDFDWKCAPWESDHVHVFPSQWQRNGGVYFANKKTAKSRQWHWRNEQTVVRQAHNNIFFVDAGNAEAAARFAQLQTQYPFAERIRYANSIFDTVARCANRATTPDFWIVHSHLIYDSFNFR